MSPTSYELCSYGLCASIAARQVEPFSNDPDFTPQQIEKASKACTAICMWALAMYQYHFVALGVAPKVNGFSGDKPTFSCCTKCSYQCSLACQPKQRPPAEKK